MARRGRIRGAVPPRGRLEPYGRSSVSKSVRNLLVMSLLLIGSCEKRKSGSGPPGSPPGPFEMDRSQKAQAERLRLIEPQGCEGLMRFLLVQSRREIRDELNRRFRFCYRLRMKG